MATEKDVQQVVHALEEGKWAPRIWFGALFAALIIAFWCLIVGDSYFRGLNSQTAMDQAQIAREIARGNGFKTKFVRPAAITQFLTNKNALPIPNMPDTFHAPLNPYINSVLLRFTKSSWQMTTKDVIYPSDRVIVGGATIFFYLAVLVNYFIAKRLFDQRLAL